MSRRQQVSKKKLRSILTDKSIAVVRCENGDWRVPVPMFVELLALACFKRLDSRIITAADGWRVMASDGGETWGAAGEHGFTAQRVVKDPVTPRIRLNCLEIAEQWIYRVDCSHLTPEQATQKAAAPYRLQVMFAPAG